MRKSNEINMGRLSEAFLVGVPQISLEAKKIIFDFQSKYGVHKIDERGREFFLFQDRDIEKAFIVYLELLQRKLIVSQQTPFLKELHETVSAFIDDENPLESQLRDTYFKVISSIGTPLDAMGVDAFFDFYDIDKGKKMIRHAIIPFDITLHEAKLSGDKVSKYLLFNGRLDPTEDPVQWKREMQKLARGIIEKATRQQSIILNIPMDEV